MIQTIFARNDTENLKKISSKHENHTRQGYSYDFASRFVFGNVDEFD